MKKILIALVLGLAGLGVAAEASWVKSAHAAPADSAGMQLSRLVLSKDAYEAMIKQMMEGILKASGQTADAKTTQQLGAVVTEALPYEELLQFNAKVYSERFKDSEILEIIAFYKTSTGNKLVRALPGISGEVAEVIGKLIPQRLPALLKKHGLTH